MARLGGDEFVVIARGLFGASNIGQLCTKAINALSLPIQAGNLTLRIGASLGCAEYPRHGDDEIHLLKNADAAMYQAKTAGGSTYVIYEANASILPGALREGSEA